MCTRVASLYAFWYIQHYLSKKQVRDFFVCWKVQFGNRQSELEDESALHDVVYFERKKMTEASKTVRGQ
jgi:hypothetical protein